MFYWMSPFVLFQAELLSFFSSLHLWLLSNMTWKDEGEVWGVCVCVFLLRGGVWECMCLCVSLEIARQSRVEINRSVNVDQSVQCVCCVTLCVCVCLQGSSLPLLEDCVCQCIGMLSPCIRTCFFPPGTTLGKYVCPSVCARLCAPIFPPTIPTTSVECVCVCVLSRWTPTNERNLSDGPHGLSLPIKTMEINERTRRGERGGEEDEEEERGRGLASSNNDTDGETIEAGQWRFYLYAGWVAGRLQSPLGCLSRANC